MHFIAYVKINEIPQMVPALIEAEDAHLACVEAWKMFSWQEDFNKSRLVLQNTMDLICHGKTPYSIPSFNIGQTYEIVPNNPFPAGIRFCVSAFPVKINPSVKLGQDAVYIAPGTNITAQGHVRIGTDGKREP